MAERVHFESDGALGSLRLDDGKANAMQRAWCDELHAALDAAAADPCRAIVLSGRAGFFSGGLDLKVLPRLDPVALRETTDRFLETMRRAFLFEKPIVAAAAGHAIAGGMMLFLCADVRLAADEPVSRYGLNEAVTGIPLTGGTLGLCTSQIPPQHHTELILHGRLVDARGAHARGVVHELAPPGELLARARARAAALADVEFASYALNKRMLRSRAFDDAARDGAELVGALSSRNVFRGLAR